MFEQSAATAKIPRCFRSHWPRKGFFASLPETSKVIYVYRDAESVAVSYWNHIFNLFGFYWLREGDMTWDQYFEKWINGDLQNGGYFEHAASWWDVKDKVNTLFLRYEDLRADTTDSIRRIAEFVGRPATPLSDERLAKILDLTSKENMRIWNEGWLDSFLIKMGIMKGEHVRKDNAKRLRCTDAQRARMVERYDAVLGALGAPLEHFFVQN